MPVRGGHRCVDEALRSAVRADIWRIPGNVLFYRNKEGKAARVAAEEKSVCLDNDLTITIAKLDAVSGEVAEWKRLALGWKRKAQQTADDADAREVNHQVCPILVLSLKGHN